MKKIIILLALFCTTLLFGQNTYTVIDQDTETPIAFVKAIDNLKNIYYSDIDGKIEFQENTGSVELRFFGFRDTAYQIISNQKDRFLRMQTDAQSYDEVIILPGENPAHRIRPNEIN